MLAACPDVAGMPVDLVNNRLTKTGIRGLQSARARLRAEQQQSQPDDTNAIYCGDTE
jgi:hypothetical protein